MQRVLVTAILLVSVLGLANEKKAENVKPQVEQAAPGSTSTEAQTEVAKSKGMPEAPPKKETPNETVDRMDKELKAKMVTNQEYRTKVEQVITKNRKDVKACKTKFKPKKGRVLITWEIDEKGQARSFSKGDDTLENEKVYHCLVHKIEKWKFGNPPYDRAMDFEHLFVF